MKIAVPTKRPPPPFVARAGTYKATLAAVAQANGSYELGWKLSAPNANAPDNSRKRSVTLPMILTAQELGAVLYDLGMAGKDVELEDLVGTTEAMVDVSTFGKRTSARVTAVRPIAKAA